MANELPWDERITVLSVHPDAASRDDVARLAAELMECRRDLRETRDCFACQLCEDHYEFQTKNISGSEG